MKRTFSAVLLLLLAACTPMQWVRPDSPPPEHIQADVQHCQAAAWNEARMRNLTSFPGYGPWRYRSPYSPFGDPYGDRFLDESRLADFCMRSKGYELAPAPKS